MWELENFTGALLWYLRVLEMTLFSAVLVCTGLEYSTAVGAIKYTPGI